MTDIARKLCWSRAKAQEICKRKFGCGIAQLHNRIRIDEATRLLLNSGTNVGEAAEACGFEDVSSFSRVFARVTGISPSQFRRKIKEG